jgi:hypothetical protein
MSKKPNILSDLESWKHRLRSSVIPDFSPRKPSAPVESDVTSDSEIDLTSSDDENNVTLRRASSLNDLDLKFNRSFLSSAQEIMDELKKTALKQISKFSGEYADLSQFLDSINHVILNNTSLTPAQTTDFLNFALRTLTLPSIYNKVKHIDTSTFGTFSAGIKEALFLNITSQTLQNSLQTIKQLENEQAHAFCERFKMAHNNLKSTLDDAILKTDYFKENIKRNFINGLRPQLKILALIHNAESLEKMMKEVISSESIKLETDISEKLDKILLISSQNSHTNNNHNRQNFRQNRGSQSNNQQQNFRGRNFRSNFAPRQNFRGGHSNFRGNNFRGNNFRGNFRGNPRGNFFQSQPQYYQPQQYHYSQPRHNYNYHNAQVHFAQHSPIPSHAPQNSQQHSCCSSSSNFPCSTQNNDQT